eukprot:3335239-Ditylum_brightwellii.AAC.1
MDFLEQHHSGFYIVSCLVSSNGSTKTATCKLFDSSKFEQRLNVTLIARHCQSDRVIPRSVFNCGVTSLAGIKGQEYIGLSLLTIICLPGCLSNKA